MSNNVKNKDLVCQNSNEDKNRILENVLQNFFEVYQEKEKQTNNKFNDIVKAINVIQDDKTKLTKNEKNSQLLEEVYSQREIIGKLEEKILFLEDSYKNLNNDYKMLKDVTYVLATDDGKMKELTKLINKLVYKKYTDKKNSLKDKLFHKAITDACYKRLYSQFEINSYKRIKIDDFDEAIKVIHRWYNNKQNIKGTVNKKLQSYVDDKDISSDKQKLVDKFLDLSQGGKDLWL